MSLILSLMGCAKEEQFEPAPAPPPVSGEPPIMTTDKKPGSGVTKVFIEELMRGIFGGR